MDTVPVAFCPAGESMNAKTAAHITQRTTPLIINGIVKLPKIPETAVPRS